MPKMSEGAAKAAVENAESADRQLEESFFGPEDSISELGDAMTPEEESADSSDDILGSLEDIEGTLNGEEDTDVEEEPDKTGAEEDAEDDSGAEDDEGDEADEADSEGDDDESFEDDEVVTVSKEALKELYDKYDAALKAAQGGTEETPQEEAEDGAGGDNAPSAEEQAQEYAKALSEAVQPVQLTDEQASQFGIHDHEGFNEFFGEVQKGIAAQSMAQLAGQLPQMILAQTSQALPFMLAAQTFIDDNPEWESHTAIVEAALQEARAANPNASPRQLVKDMEGRITLSRKKGEAIAGQKRGSKKHDARQKTRKGQFKNTARRTGGKKGSKVVGTESVLRDMIRGGSNVDTDDDFAAF